MLKTSLFTVLLMLAGCGLVHDGDSGADGSNGKSPKCSVEVKDGVQNLICENADGSIAKVEIKDGKPGSSGVLAYSLCALNWPGVGDAGAYDIHFDVVHLKDGHAFLSLLVNYKTQAGVDFTESASLIVSGAKVVETAHWKAELKSNTEAVVYRKSPSQSKPAVCSYKN